MATRIKCTGSDFAGLVNPYTGKPVVTEMVVLKDGSCVFCAPDTYSTADYFPTAKEAYDAWARSLGIDGARRNGVIACAYTGNPLSVVKTDFGYHYEGGFDPHMMWPRHEYLNMMTMRDGNPGPKVWGPPVPVEPAGAEKSAPIRHHEVDITTEAERRAEQAMKDAGFAPRKKTRVSMSVPKGGKGR